MSNSIVPEPSDRSDISNRPIKSQRSEKSLSEKLLEELSPKVLLHGELLPRMHVNEFTSGEIIGNESANKLPLLKGKEAAFIPLHLARDYVKKVKNYLDGNGYERYAWTL